MQPASLYALVKSQSFFWGKNFIYRQDIARTHRNINEQRNLWATGPWIFINKMALLLKAEFYFSATRWLNSQLHYVDALQRQVFHNQSLFLEFIEILITYRAILYFTYKFHVLTTRRKITNENLHIFDQFYTSNTADHFNLSMLARVHGIMTSGIITSGVHLTQRTTGCELYSFYIRTFKTLENESDPHQRNCSSLCTDSCKSKYQIRVMS